MTRRVRPPWRDLRDDPSDYDPERKRAYYLEHMAERLAYQRAYDAAHREEIRARKRDQATADTYTRGTGDEPSREDDRA